MLLLAGDPLGHSQCSGTGDRTQAGRTSAAVRGQRGACGAADDGREGACSSLPARLVNVLGRHRLNLRSEPTAGSRMRTWVANSLN